MAKKVLAVLSGHGYWGEELVGPLQALDAAGNETEFVTPKGTKPAALPPSMDETYFDPPLGRPVTTKAMADNVKKVEKSDRLSRPKDLSSWFPERPYFSAQMLVRELDNYYNKRDAAWADVEPYSALLLVGGSGPIVEDRKSIIRNKHVTDHCLEYDYKDGTGFPGTDFKMGPPPYPLEYIVRDATAPDGAYHGNFGREISVIVDYPFITGKSTVDSLTTGRKLVEVLENGVRRYGW